MEQTRDGDPLRGGELKPLPGTPLPATQALTTHQDSESAREVAMVRTAFELAVIHPRDEVGAANALMHAVSRPTFAERCEYRFPRSGQDVTGPSVELAREAARCWGHLLSGYQIINEDEERIHLQAWAWDVQTGARDHAEARFKKKIQRKRQGQTVWITPDERDLDELIARRAAKLVRNCLLHVMPSDLIDDAVATARVTMQRDAQQQGETEEDRADFMSKIVRAIEGLDLTVEQVEKWMGAPLDTITPEQVADLKAILTSIRDGNSKASEYFGGTAKAEPEPAAEESAKPRTLADLTQQSAQPVQDAPSPAVDDDDDPFGNDDGEPWPKG